MTLLKRAVDGLRRKAPTPFQVYSIGVLAGSNPLSLSEPHPSANPVLTASDVSDRDAAFVADPFMLKVDGMWHMFFEVMLSSPLKGVIGWATSPNGLAWQYEQVVLEEPYHLSYPHVFACNDEFFMVPETQEMSAVKLYRARKFPTEWHLVRNLLLGSPYSDSTLYEHDGTWFLFTETNPHYRSDTLRLYFSHNLHGAWHEHPQSPIVQWRPPSRPTCWQDRPNTQRDREACSGLRWSIRYFRGTVPRRRTQPRSICRAQGWN